MEEECGICGLNIDDKFSYTLNCQHKFHYECLMKTFQNTPKYKNKDFNNCPYCRNKSEFLPLVNGLKKVIPGVHTYNTSSEVMKKKEELNDNYNIKCQHILIRGKNKGNVCSKNCLLGYTFCKTHYKK
tara:strand:- start:31 stop:414 length:384 start_codon:yes stop_codon:yes gene_type:complete